MTVEEAISYIEDFTWSTSRLGLDRTRELLARLGDPQRELRFVHVAGSNGKGSTCAMTESVLRAAGYRTGLYISPYIQEFCERIRCCGENIPGEALAEITEQVREAAEAMEDHPSQFELVTAIGMLYFRRMQADIVVLEVGMGGALDSTNVIDAPETAVITNIGLEHTQYLGNTLEEIAATKSGIIKPGCSVVCYDGAAEVTAVVKARAERLACPVYYNDFSKLVPLSADLSGQTFSYEGVWYRIRLLGEHQLHNAVTTLNIIRALRDRGWRIGPEAVSRGLAETEWPARFEVLQKDPLFILDGGHNPQCAEALARCLDRLLPEQRIIFLISIFADKDYDRVLDILAPYALECHCLEADNPRALPLPALLEELEKRNIKAIPHTSVEEGIASALQAAADHGCPAVSFGSLYQAGAVRTAYFARSERPCKQDI